MDEHLNIYLHARALAAALARFREAAGSQLPIDDVFGIDAEIVVAEVALRRFAFETGLASGLFKLNSLPDPADETDGN